MADGRRVGKFPQDVIGDQPLPLCVVVDECLAFSGGLDITGHRWDTPSHQLANRFRVDTAGNPYRPFHDVQAMVDGPAARALAQIVKERWRAATEWRVCRR